GPDPRNFNQRVSLGRNDLLIRTFLSVPPQQPIAKLEVNAAQKLVNAGNQRLKILTIAYCKNNSKENCKIQTVNKNIFPGQERNLESISGYDKIVVKYNNWITKDNGEFELAVH
ncbi:hypothetical protein IXW63_20505, partial [Escherichia coli]|nr:hypothetical protein [Escherichia coli]